MTTTKTKTKIEWSVPKLQPNPFMHEILGAVSKQRTVAQKVETLQAYKNPALTTILIMNFDESVVSILPEGDVPYAGVDEQTSVGGNLSDLVNSKTKNQGLKTSGYYGTEDFVEEKNKTSIRNEYQNFYIYCRNGNNQITQMKKETMFINMLSGLHPFEAEIMILVKDKKLQNKYKITKDIISQAYPEITWGGRS
jgi:hypothetical protein